jgi:hypothetical protein
MSGKNPEKPSIHEVGFEIWFTCEIFAVKNFPTHIRYHSPRPTMHDVVVHGKVFGSGFKWVIRSGSRQAKIWTPKKGKNEEISCSLLGWRLLLEPDCPLSFLRRFLIFFAINNLVWIWIRIRIGTGFSISLNPELDSVNPDPETLVHGVQYSIS